MSFIDLGAVAATAVDLVQEQDRDAGGRVRCRGAETEGPTYIPPI